MKNIFILIHSILDRLLKVILMLFFLGLFYLISKFFKLKTPKKTNTDLTNRKILFLASGKPIKYPGFKDLTYSKMWHEAFQKQLRLPCFSSTYIFYEEAEEKDIYKLSSNIVALAIPIQKKTYYFPRMQSLLMSLKSFIFLSYLIWRIKPQIICTNAPGNNLIMSSLLSHFYGINLIAQVMGSYDLSTFDDSLADESRLKLIIRNLNKIILSFFFRQADLILAYNQYCGTFAIHNGAHPKKIRHLRITPSYYDTTELKIHTKKQLNYPKTKKNIILWGRLSPEKKNYFAIKSALEVLKTDSSFGFILIGYGPLSEQVKKLVDTSGVDKQVTLHGYKPFHELMSFIHHSDIALLPLAGYALVEAALMKKPIVCYDIEWHRELLNNNAYFADYPEESQIKAAILEIISHPEEAKRRANNAYKQAKNMFCPITLKTREYQVIYNFLQNKTA